MRSHKSESWIICYNKTNSKDSEKDKTCDDDRKPKQNKTKQNKTKHTVSLRRLLTYLTLLLLLAFVGQFNLKFLPLLINICDKPIPEFGDLRILASL